MLGNLTTCRSVKSAGSNEQTLLSCIMGGGGAKLNHSGRLFRGLHSHWIYVLNQYETCDLQYTVLGLSPAVLSLLLTDMKDGGRLLTLTHLFLLCFFLKRNNVGKAFTDEVRST